jgi:hypothetical protein
MSDNAEVIERARQAMRARQSDEEISMILKELPGGFVASLKAFRNIAGIGLNEANFRLRLTSCWSKYFGDSEEQLRMWKSLLLKEKH